MITLFQNRQKMEIASIADVSSMQGIIPEDWMLKFVLEIKAIPVAHHHQYQRPFLVRAGTIQVSCMSQR